MEILQKEKTQKKLTPQNKLEIKKLFKDGKTRNEILRILK